MLLTPASVSYSSLQEPAAAGWSGLRCTLPRSPHARGHPGGQRRLGTHTQAVCWRQRGLSSNPSRSCQEVLIPCHKAAEAALAVGAPSPRINQQTPALAAAAAPLLVKGCCALQWKGKDRSLLVPANLKVKTRWCIVCSKWPTVGVFEPLPGAARRQPRLCRAPRWGDAGWPGLRCKQSYTTLAKGRGLRTGRSCAAPTPQHRPVLTAPL